MAAYYGCFSPKNGVSKQIDVVPINLNIGGLHGSFDVGVRGYENAAALPNGAAVDLGATIIPIANTNILVLRGADSQVLVGSGANTATAVYASTTAPLVAGCVQGICADSVVVVSDCAKSRIFQVSVAPTVGANTLTLQHTDAWGGNSLNFDTYFDKLSEVALMKTVVYFVAEGNGADNGPSLYQRVNNEPAVELVEDVENVSFTYGINGTNYKRAVDMLATEWAQVTAVRIELLVRSDMDNVVEDKQPYAFAGNTVAQANVPDKRIRKVFMATVGVRSR
jgi:type IV pilus assembly protein PilW